MQQFLIAQRFPQLPLSFALFRLLQCMVDAVDAVSRRCHSCGCRRQPDATTDARHVQLCLLCSRERTRSTLLVLAQRAREAVAAVLEQSQQQQQQLQQQQQQPARAPRSGSRPRSAPASPISSDCEGLSRASTVDLAVLFSPLPPMHHRGGGGGGGGDGGGESGFGSTFGSFFTEQRRPDDGATVERGGSDQDDTATHSHHQGADQGASPVMHAGDIGADLSYSPDVPRHRDGAIGGAVPVSPPGQGAVPRTLSFGSGDSDGSGCRGSLKPAEIIDFSPTWDYAPGGAKLLICLAAPPDYWVQSPIVYFGDRPVHVR